ncbi:MAG: autotransporter domain-containing protein [Alphaproteobacteria bacterium]|nr:autotransporter domain-containing protein [Alphaproteobacteria bacterium]
MRLTRTAIRELTKKYRAVLRNCALALLATMCVVNNVKAEDAPTTAYTNASKKEKIGEKDIYYGSNANKELYISASENVSKGISVAIHSSDYIAGDYKADDSVIEAIKVIMNDGTVGNVYGGYSDGTGSISGNTVNILGGTTKIVYGGYHGENSLSAGSISGNTVNILGGTTDTVYGGYSTGLEGSSTIANNNIVTIKGGTIESVYGGQSKCAKGSASGNIVNVLGGEITTNVYGGNAANGGNVIGNIVKISGGTIKSVYGGSSEGIESNNAVLISGNPKFTGNIGAGSAVNSSVSENNILAISETPTFENVNIIGGKGTVSNNTLILNTKVSGLQNVMFFENYVFVMTNNVSDGKPILSATKTINLTDTKVAVGAAKSGVNLNVGDSVVLMNNVTGTPTLDNSLFSQTNISKYAYAVNLNYNFSIKVEDDKLIAYLDSITPEAIVDNDVVNGLFTGAKNAINSTNEAVKTSLRTRLSQLSGVPTSSSNASSKKGQSGGDEDAKYGLWAQALYNHVKRNSSSNSVGFKGHSEGIVIGSDTEVIDDFTAGLAYSYTKSNMKSVGEKTDIKTHGFFAYGQYKPNEYFVNGSIGFGLSKADPKDGDDDVKSKFYSVDALAGYETSSDYGMIIPAAGLRYVRIEQKSYNDGEIRLKAKDSNTLTAVAQLGWKNDYKVDNTNLTARASLGFIYDLKSDNNKVNITTGNAHLLSEDGRLKRFGTELNAGVDTKLNNQWGLSLDYNGEYRQHYKNHTGTVSVKYDF